MDETTEAIDPADIRCGVTHLLQGDGRIEVDRPVRTLTGLGAIFAIPIMAVRWGLIETNADP